MTRHYGRYLNIRAVRSSPHVVTMAPSLLTARPSKSLVWPVHVCMHVPVLASHARTFLSRDAVYTMGCDPCHPNPTMPPCVVPLHVRNKAWKASAVGCRQHTSHVSVCRSRNPWLVSQMHKEPSRPPVARYGCCGLNWTASTEFSWTDNVATTFPVPVATTCGVIASLVIHGCALSLS
jgi:hypothetical protein